MTLSLTCQRFAWERAFFATPPTRDNGEALDAIAKALKGGGHVADLVAVKLTEKDAKRVAAICEQAGRVRSAEAIERAIRLAKSKDVDDDGLSERREVLAMLESEGGLTPSEKAAAERLGLFK